MNNTLPEHILVTKEQCNQGGAGMAELYKKFYFERKEKYPVEGELSGKAEFAVRSLIDNGYAVVRGAIETEKINALKDELASLIGQSKFLGQNNEYFIQINQPMLRSKCAFDLAFSSIVREISTGYYGVVPSIGTTNLRRSLVNVKKDHNFNKHGNLFFHYDNNSPWFLKFFFYLNDVELSDGPFVYVQGSHREKIKHWWRSKRYSDEMVESLYGTDRIKYLTAKAGDLIVANTRGIHKGLKTVNNHRDMLTVNLVMHPEISSSRWTKITDDHPPGAQSVSKEWVEALPEEAKPFADYLIKK